MSSHEQDVMAAGQGAPGYRSGHSIFARSAARRPGFLAALLITGFIVGIAYRLLMDPATERDLPNCLRSGLHGVGLALALWAVQTGFASTARSSARRSGDC